MMSKTQASIKAIPMATNTQKQQPVVTLRITPGPLTPYHHAAWRNFWQKLIAEVKNG